MELDLQSLFGLHVTWCTQLYPAIPPPPPNLGSYTRAQLVSQEGRHLFITPCIDWLSAILFLELERTDNNSKEKWRERYRTVLLYNGGFCNSCITKWCLHKTNSTVMVLIHDCSMIKDESYTNLKFCHFLNNNNQFSYEGKAYTLL